MSDSTTDDADQQANYEQAQFYFVHREFGHSADILSAKMLNADMPTTLVPSWLLLFALCGRAFSEPDTESWPIASDSRKWLRNLVQSGDLWTKLETSFDQTNENIPALLITSSFTLAAKYMSNTRPVTIFVENAMAVNPVPDQVFVSYVTEILVKTQRDFYYARELVNHQTKVDKKPLLDAIDQAESAYLASISRKQAEETALEEQRVADAKAKTAEAEISDSAVLPTESIANNEKTQAEISVNQPSVPTRPHTGLVDFWKQWVRQFIRSQGLYNTLIVAAALASIYVNHGTRTSVLRGSKWLALIIRRGLSMALQVTYL